MSIIQFGNECPAILTSIQELSKNVSFDTKVGILTGLHAPQNLNAGDVKLMDMASMNGSTRQVRVAYRKRQTPDDIVEEDNCDEGTDTPWYEETISVSQVDQMSVTFTFDFIRKLCENYAQWVNMGRPADGDQIKLMMDAASQIVPDLDAMRQRIASKAHLAFIAGLGDFADGDAGPNTYNMLNTTGGSLNQVGFADFELDLAKIASGLRPIAFGSNNIWKAVRALGYGCCNDGGVDWNRMREAGAGFDFFSDFSVNYTDVYSNANAFGMWIPGAFQYVPVLENLGPFAQKIDNVTHSVMSDPMIPGLRYDIKLIENGCDKKYTFKVTAKYDFWTKPDIYKAEDRLSGVTGLFQGIAASV